MFDLLTIGKPGSSRLEDSEIGLYKIILKLLGDRNNQERPFQKVSAREEVCNNLTKRSLVGGTHIQTSGFSLVSDE